VRKRKKEEERERKSNGEKERGMEGEKGGLVSKVFFTKWYIERVNA
jgi:hypothetical protein